MLGVTSIIVVRLQNLDYPNHAQLLKTMKEIVRNDLIRLRLLYLGVAPLAISMCILALASTVAF